MVWQISILLMHSMTLGSYSHFSETHTTKWPETHRPTKMRPKTHRPTKMRPKTHRPTKVRPIS